MLNGEKKRHSGHDQSRLVSRNRGFYCDRELPEPQVTRLQKALYSAYVTQDTKGFHGGLRFLPYFLLLKVFGVLDE